MPEYRAVRNNSNGRVYYLEVETEREYRIRVFRESVLRVRDAILRPVVQALTRAINREIERRQVEELRRRIRNGRS